MINLNYDQTDASLTFPGKEIDLAWLTSPTEQNISPLQINDNTVMMTLLPRKPETIRVKFSDK